MGVDELRLVLPDICAGEENLCGGGAFGSRLDLWFAGLEDRMREPLSALRPLLPPTSLLRPCCIVIPTGEGWTEPVVAEAIDVLIDGGSA